MKYETTYVGHLIADNEPKSRKSNATPAASIETGMPNAAENTVIINNSR